MTTRQARAALHTLALISFAFVFAGCGGGGGGSSSTTQPGTTNLTVRIADGYSNLQNPTLVTGAKVYLVNTARTALSPQLTDNLNGTYGFNGSTQGYSYILVIPPTINYHRTLAGRPDQNAARLGIGVYQQPLDENDQFIPNADETQYALIPLPTTRPNIGTLYVFRDTASNLPPAPDYPGPPPGPQ